MTNNIAKNSAYSFIQNQSHVFGRIRCITKTKEQINQNNKWNATNVCLYAWNPVAFSTNCNDKKKKMTKGEMVYYHIMTYNYRDKKKEYWFCTWHCVANNMECWEIIFKKRKKIFLHITYLDLGKFLSIMTDIKMIFEYSLFVVTIIDISKPIGIFKCFWCSIRTGSEQ